eukprot:680267-Hanusia_phi.AAC.2
MIAFTSSSFSACASPSVSHASQLSGCACTSASSACTDSTSSPRCSISTPDRKQSGRPRKGLTGAKV